MNENNKVMGMVAVKVTWKVIYYTLKAFVTRENLNFHNIEIKPMTPAPSKDAEERFEETKTCK